MESSPRFRSTNSSADDNNSTHPTKLRLMCSNGGHIVPRPHDKSLRYVGGDTRMVVVDRHTSLFELTRRLSKTLFRSSSATASFTLKYQLPSEDLDSLISVTTDEDLENMIEEYERLNDKLNDKLNDRLNSSSRIRLFVFPKNPESVSSIGSFLENPVKSEDWFLNALNGTNSGFSDTSSVNCLLDLDDEICDKKDVSHKGGGIIGTNLIVRGSNSGQDIHSVPESTWMETTSSFGSASSTPSIANLPPIKVNGDDYSKSIVGGEGATEEQVSQTGVQNQKQNHKVHDAGGLVDSPAPAVVSGSPTMIQENSDPFFSCQGISDQGLQMTYLNQHHHHQQQQNQSTGFDSILSDLSITDQSSPVSQNQSPNFTPDQITRIQNSPYLSPMQRTQVESPRHQLHYQQPQLIQPLQYIHHHPSPAMTPYYHHHHLQQQPPPMDQQNFMYYIPASRAPQGYSFPFQQPQQPSHNADHKTAAAAAAVKTELPAAYRTSSGGGGGAGVPQLVRVQSGYYAAATQAMAPQYQNMMLVSPVETKLQEQVNFLK